MIWGVLRGQAFHGEGIYDDRDVVRHRALRCDEVDHPRERGDPEAYVGEGSARPGSDQRTPRKGRGRLNYGFRRMEATR